MKFITTSLPFTFDGLMMILELKEMHSVSPNSPISWAFRSPGTYIIPAESPAPGFELQDRTSRLFRDALNWKGRTIIALHYAGHEMPNDFDELVLTTNYKGQASGRGHYL